MCSRIPKGPGYATPLDAYNSSKKEEILYAICIQSDPKNTAKPDYLAVIDVNSDSPNYCQVINRTYMTHVGDELHHFGWNSCSSCYKNPNKKRNKLILPALGSDRIYILNVDNLKSPVLEKVIENDEVRKLGLSTLHSTHCSPQGEILISAMGDQTGQGVGDFLVIDEESLEVKGRWIASGKTAKFGYDFWYQPYHDVLVSSEWGSPCSFKKGCIAEDVSNPDVYGRSINIFSWSKRKLLQTIDLGLEGAAPLEIRFLHDPKADQGYVGCAVFAKIFRFFKKNDGTWAAEKVIDIEPKKVDGHSSPELNGMITDILISMDDKFLYFTNWMHGDVRQYDITNPAKPRLVGQIFLGGKLQKDGPLKLIYDPEGLDLHDPVYVKGKRLYGSPQMFQLSLDGKRLYVSPSLYSPWDKQFYPETQNYGGYIVKLNVNTVVGGLSLDPDFYVDFEKEPEGPSYVHELRYPGGDCTSDIYTVDECSCT